MARERTMISVYTETRDRLFAFKRPGITYDEIINRAIGALEEQQKNNSQACSCKSEPGNDQNHTRDCKEVIV